MSKTLRPAATLFVLLTLLTGVAYPLVVTGVAQAGLARQANGSLILRDGLVVGSELIGQPFDAPGYFWGRPSATAPHPGNAAASTGSNLGPSNPALREAVEGRIAALREAAAGTPGADVPVPIDLVTASGSGLDPHVSPAAALYQVPRVARARHLDEPVVRDLVNRHIEGRTFGILGEPRVNVVRLNLALDAMHR